MKTLLSLAVVILLCWAPGPTQADPLAWHFEGLLSGQPLARTDQPDVCYRLVFTPPFTGAVLVREQMGVGAVNPFPPFVRNVLWRESWSFGGMDLYSLDWQTPPPGGC